MAIAVGVSPTASSASASSVTTAAVTTTSNSTIYLFLTINEATFSSVSDSASNSWTQVGTTLTNTGTFAQTRVYENVAGTRGGSHTFTLTGTGATTLSLFVIETTGSATTSPTDQQTRQNDNTSPINSGDVTTTQAAEMLLGFGSSDSGLATWTANNSFTKLDEVTDQSLGWCQCTATRIVASTGTYSADFTETGLAVGMCWIVTVKEAVGSGSLMFRGS